VTVARISFGLRVLSVETELPSGLARICHRVILINADIKAIIV